MTWDYNTIKQLAKKYGVKVDHLLALAPANDPFYVGSKTQMKLAEWFDGIYTRMGRPAQCHIRRAHYWYMHQPNAVKINGTPYENEKKDWDALLDASKYARYQDLIPLDNIIDRRNPRPKIFIETWEDKTPSEIKDDIDADTIIKNIVEQFDIWNPHNTQPYHLELWCEKSTMNDILVPIGQEWGVNVVTGLGELSITAVNQLIERILTIEKPVRIFYISDFDPSGEGMPISVGRKIEYFVRSLEIGEDVKLKPLLLTADQCEKYNLPRSPIKKDSRRKRKFEARHGEGATELDALEALYPGEMKKIILGEITQYIDADAWNEVQEKNKAVQKTVRGYLKEKMGGVIEELVEGIQEIDLKEHDKFIPRLGDEIDDFNDSWLYDSDLDYIKQIARYKKFRNARTTTETEATQ